MLKVCYENLSPSNSYDFRVSLCKYKWIWIYIFIHLSPFLHYGSILYIVSYVFLFYILKSYGGFLIWLHAELTHSIII